MVAIVCFFYHLPLSWFDMHAASMADLPADVLPG
jgi:hypothetical protein